MLFIIALLSVVFGCRRRAIYVVRVSISPAGQLNERTLPYVEGGIRWQRFSCNQKGRRPLQFDEESHPLRTILMFTWYCVAWCAVCMSWPIWRGYMAVRPVHAPPFVELRRRGRRRRLKRQLRTAVMVIAAIVIPVLGLLYFGPMP
jgi:hypothetical protein